MRVRKIWTQLNPYGIRTLRRSAGKARDARDWRAAALLYEQILDVRPDDTAIRVQAGHMRKEAGDLAAAEAHYLSAKSRAPMDADLALQLGHFYKIFDRPLDAAAAYRQAVALDPLSDAAQAEYANIRHSLSQTLGILDEELELLAFREAAKRITADDVRTSGLFDPHWYLARNSELSGIHPLTHFLEHGRFEGRAPGPDFELDWYVATYPQVHLSGLDAFSHYLLIGRKQGLKPSGPPMYERWVNAFDTLEDVDRQEIDTHIASARLPRPDVLLSVTGATAPFVGEAVQSLRRQRLQPRQVEICLSRDCPPETANAIIAMTGSDHRFQLRARPAAGATRPIRPSMDDAPLIVLDAAVTLREHALYLLVEAYQRGAAFGYGDEDQINDSGVRHSPLFKPDASPQLLRQVDYLGACALLPGGSGSEVLASALASDTTDIVTIIRDAFLSQPSDAVAHVPHVLYHDRGKLLREVRPGSGPAPTLDEITLPSVTVIVPARDRLDPLRVCIESVLSVTDYPRDRLEVVILDDGSTDTETVEYLAHSAFDPRFRVLRDPTPSNYLRLNNIAAQTATSDILVLLDNDTEVQDPSWLRGLVRYASQSDVAAVSPKLLCRDGTIQHAGVVVGTGTTAAQIRLGLNYEAKDPSDLVQRTREVAAVTGACLAMRRSVFEEIGGFDEHLAPAFGDIDLCLSALDRGYRNLYVHDVWLRHFASAGIGMDEFVEESNYVRRKHPAAFDADPFYNPNLSVMSDSVYELAFPPRRVDPWRDNGRRLRRPRALLLAAITDPTSEIALTVGFEARYLTDAGFDVLIGTSRRIAPLAPETAATSVILPTMQSAAIYAVEHHIDCIVSHSASYAGVSRLVGKHLPVFLYHHGFTAEVAAGAYVGQDTQVALRLALPIAAAVLAASAYAAREVIEDAIVLPPGGDHIGRWSIACEADRQSVREQQGWTGRIVILVEAAPASETNGEPDVIEAVSAYLDLSRVALWRLPAVSEPAMGQVQRKALLVGADLLWQTGPHGSPLLAAEAAALGLPILSGGGEDARSADTASRIALRIGEAITATNAPSSWSRTAVGATWGTTMERLVEIIGGHGAIATAAPVKSAQTLLAPRPLIEESGLFDTSLYAQFNPDVVADHLDPWIHFSTQGGADGRRSSHLFHSEWYLARYPEVARARVIPIAHYLSRPLGSYDPNPYFSNEHYLSKYPDVAKSGLSPLVHYLRIGAAEGRSIGPDFDPAFYARTYADVAKSGMAPFVHFLTVGDDQGRLSIKPRLFALDLFDDVTLAAALKRSIENVVPRPAGADDIVDRRSAARFCITLLRTRPDLRARFPAALSDGNGAFAHWLIETSHELELPRHALHFVRGLFNTDFADRIRQIYLVRADLRRLLPFALLPEGAGSLLEWGLDHGIASEGISLEEIWWLLLSCYETPARQLSLTYMFNPSWQINHPAALSVFGDDAFISWLAESYGVSAAWTDQSHSETLTPAEEIRLGYLADRRWQDAHPDAFASADQVRALLTWLDSPEIALPIRAATWLAAQDRESLTSELIVPGINLLGHFCYPSGLRTSTEALVRGCLEAGLRIEERDVWVQLPGDDNRHVDFHGLEIYDTTIIFTQPKPFFDVAYPRAGLAPRSPRTYRIAFWYWELDVIPDHWRMQVDQVDEIWTSTHFVGDALKAQFDLPIKVIPNGMEVPKFERLPRSYFGIPEDHFLFLFTFHMMSVMERKNPMALIKSFSAEFSKDEKVTLILKTSFGDAHPQQIADLRREASGFNIIIIDSVYTKDEVLALTDACDAYISLHRSEGFGLTMVEAMLLGKPTIATGYSANLDFMTPDNSLLVEYDLVTLDQDYPPYKAGNQWAEASTNHARACMRRVESDPDWAREIGLRGKADLEAQMSFARSGEMVSKRLAEITNERAAL